MILDVGETLVDETRVWTVWADALGVPRLTFMAAMGAVIARGGEHRDTFDVLGFPDWRSRFEAVNRTYGAFTPADLYADALPSVAALKGAGFRVAIVANQPANRSAELRALGFEPDAMAMSGELGVAKPDPPFFDRALALLGDPDRESVAYVGDRVDNDVVPARDAGLRAIWIQRGPWGTIQDLPPGLIPDLVVGSLAELVKRVGEVWPVIRRGAGSPPPPAR